MIWSDYEDDFLKRNFALKTHLEIANDLRRTRASVRNRCHRLGLVDHSDKWTEQDLRRLKSAYENAEFSEQISLGALASKLGRLKSNVCRKARKLGLTDIARPAKRIENRSIRKPMFASKEALSKHRSQTAKKMIAEKGHPRGSLGMKHTEETKAKIAEASRIFNARLTHEQKLQIAIKGQKTKTVNGTSQNMNRANATWGSGWRVIGGVKKYYRSKWEANYARYLEWLKANGEIQSWLHEPETFWFDGIRRGCLSYLPDFKVIENDGRKVFHEVKGWMDDRSKTKIKRMAKYHPEVKLIVIDAKGYGSIKKVMQPIIKDWESDSKGR